MNCNITPLLNLKFLLKIWKSLHGSSVMLEWAMSSYSKAVMSLPIRYLPMASYFWLSIIFLTPQILRHAPRQHNPLQHSHDHHWLFPIPIAPWAWHHVVDLSYDLWTTVFYFPFLVPFLLPNVYCCSPTDHKSSHHVVGALPSVLPHMDLALILLIICI